MDMNRFGSRVWRAVGAAGWGVGIAVSGLVVDVVCLVFFVVSLALLPVGVGFVAVPAVLGVVRRYASRRRTFAEKWGGVRIAAVYREVPRGAGAFRRTWVALGDPQTWRDVRWLVADLVPGYVFALTPALLLGKGVEGVALPFGLWKAYGEYWYEFVPVTDQGSAFLAGLLGAGFLLLAYRYNTAILMFHLRFTKAVLGADHEELTARVRVLTDTRRDAVDTSAAELRRIERDLHDGAQARLVVMSMDLGTIEALMEHDPAKAKALLAQARRNSAEVLEELRDLVRGIHPPVLAERGLGDAVRALALRLPLPVEVEVELGGRAEAPVESAAYFAVSELLTNAVKHSGADRIWVDMRHTDGSLRISVTDNGRGGATIGGGIGGGMSRTASPAIGSTASPAAGRTASPATADTSSPTTDGPTNPATSRAANPATDDTSSPAASPAPGRPASPATNSPTGSATNDAIAPAAGNHPPATTPTGSGLTGIERRLGTFDGVLAVSSPVGGPTTATLEIPCALS